MKKFFLPGKFILAPMAGMTDYAFREQCKRYGAALVVTELTSVEGIVRKSDDLDVILDVQKEEKPSIQLFGNDVKNIVKAAQIVEPLASVIDFNIGCPAPHITAQACGSALLMEPDHLHKIISSLVDAVDLPVTAKIRAGPSDNKLVYKSVAKTIEEAGASMITLHPRTVKQGYSGTADWSRIKDVKDVLKIPVCGNGDVTSPEASKQMMDETNCDYVMIGRGALGNPFLFEQCNDFLKKGSYKEYSTEDKILAWNDYLERALKFNVKFSRLKVQAQNFSKGLPIAKEVRRKLSPARTVDDLRRAFVE